MPLKPIRSAADHSAALRRLEKLWAAPKNSTAATELDAWASLVDAYKRRQLKLPPAEPHEVLRYAVSELRHSQAELAILLGSRSRANEVLAGKRPLTLTAIRKTHAAWRIPIARWVGVDVEAAA